MTTLTIGITGSNIRSNPLQRLAPVRERIDHAASFPGFNFGSEIFPGRRTKALRKRNRQLYTSLWIQRMHLHGKASTCVGYEEPISFDPLAWDKISEALIFVHKGKHKVSENRYMGSLSVIHTATKIKAKLLSCHTISEGYKTGAAARGVHELDFRRKMLDVYLAKQQHETAAALRSHHVVITGGDMNDPRPPAPHPHAVQLAGSGLDHLWAVPATGYRIGNISRDLTHRNRAMDHPIVHATFDLISL